MDERTKRLLDRFPLPDQLSVKDAADIMGGPHWIPFLMREVAEGFAPSFSHAPKSGPAKEHVNYAIGERSELPRFHDGVDPAYVFLQKEDVLWCWCDKYEEDLQGAEFPPKEEVEARYAWLLKLAGSGLSASAKSAPATGDVLTTRERRNLLAVIAALCKELRVDYRDRGLAKRISGATCEVGKPVSEEKIRLLLREIENEVGRTGR